MGGNAESCSPAAAATEADSPPRPEPPAAKRTAAATTAAREGKWAAARRRLEAEQSQVPAGAAGLGRRIRAARVACQLSLRELASKAQVSHVTVACWERGESYPCVDDLERLAAVLKYSVGWLIGWSVVPSPKELDVLQEALRLFVGVHHGVDTPASMRSPQSDAYDAARKEQAQVAALLLDALRGQERHGT